MNSHADKRSQNKNQPVANLKRQSGGEPVFRSIDNRPETIAQKKLQETINNSANVKQLKVFQAMADQMQPTHYNLFAGNTVIQPMLRNRGNGSKSKEPEPQPGSKSKPAPKKDYEITGISAGTECYRFIILLNNETPDTGQKEFTDDNEGGVSLTLDPDKTPKGRRIKGRWKATYVLKNDMDLYNCTGKQIFETVLKQGPDRLCYTST